jgi:uncharacterized protein YkwD
MTGRGWASALCIAGVLQAGAATADVETAAALNDVRLRGCGGKAGIGPPLSADPRLDAAAGQLSQGMQLGDALPRTGYRATRWAQISMSGTSGAKAVADQVARNFCHYLLDAAFLEVGVHRRGNQAWIVFAAPFAPPATADAGKVGVRVLELVNQARARQRICGNAVYAAAGPLRLNEKLVRAAAVHSDDMAARGFFSHDGSDGSSVMTRATRVGYNGRAVGENIASGQATPEAAVDGWMKSPPHCANLMQPGFTEMGVAFTVNRASPMGIYWTQVLGTPR